MVGADGYQVGDAVPPSFALVRRLGAGIFGTVFEAIDDVLERRIAIKILRPELGKAFSERMRREWKALARLQDEHIVGVLTAGFTTDLGLPYFTMPLVRGATLRELLTSTGALPADQALDVGVQLFEALRAAHEQDVVHRDVKPENILIARPSGRTMRLKLTDFGLVCSASAKHPTAQGLLGTHAYAAPELFFGGAPSIGTDLYAGGVVLFEMLTGIRPLTSGDADWRRLHIEVAPVSLEQVLPNAPVALVELLTRVSPLRSSVERAPAVRA
jgi:serine/threonine-protein kinase